MPGAFFPGDRPLVSMLGHITSERAGGKEGRLTRVKADGEGLFGTFPALCGIKSMIPKSGLYLVSQIFVSQPIPFLTSSQQQVVSNSGKIV